jgi:3-oxoacyl-[acyl-carrier-protein] synthase II
MVILETLEHALARKAEILAEIVGYGSTADAFRITDQHPDGAGAIVAMQEALADAKLSPRDITTSTRTVPARARTTATRPARSRKSSASTRRQFQSAASRA